MVTVRTTSLSADLRAKALRAREESISRLAFSCVPRAATVESGHVATALAALGRDGVLVIENAHVLVEGGRGVRVDGVRGPDAAKGDHRGGHHAGDQDAGSRRLRRRARR